MKKVILHCDLNCFYASCEMIDKPYLKNVPMCVGGDQTKRHGVVLAKNSLAKKAGIKTGEPLIKSFQKCPNLKVVAPDMEKYLSYSKKVQQIFCEYSDLVQPFGIDEAWIDITKSIKLFGSVEKIVESILKKVYEQLNLTLSIGISDNKIYSKLASDLAGEQEYIFVKDINDIKNLNVEKLLMVGQKTKEKLFSLNVKSIGDLYNCSKDFLYKNFGKNGLYLYDYVRGKHLDEVKNFNDIKDVKSIGNSTTTFRDLTNIEDIKIVLNMISEKIAQRLKKQQYFFKTIKINIKNNKFECFTFQKTLSFASNTTKTIFEESLKLFKNNHNFKYPIRALGISVSNLTKEKEKQQLNLFSEMKVNKDEKKEEIIDCCLDKIKEKYGNKKIARANIFLDKKLSNFNIDEN